jgi:Tfp pilus assembly protein PilN
LLIGAGIWQVQSYLHFQGENEYLHESLLKVEESRRALEKEMRSIGIDPTEAGVKDFNTKISTLNDLIAQRTFSWTLFLNELESAVPNNISVIRLQPKFREGLITLNGKAISLKDLTKFIIRLEDSRVFSEVFLKDQQTGKEGFIDFTVEFKYHSQKRAIPS